MIKAEQIPDGVAASLKWMILRGEDPKWALAAALSAWPNGEVRPSIQKLHDTAWYPPYISLPLPQEPRT